MIPSTSLNIIALLIPFSEMNNPVNPMPMMRPNVFGRPSADQMMSMAAKMRQAMWMKAKKDMNRRRAMFLMSMAAGNRRREPVKPKFSPKRQSIVPLYFMYKMHQKMMKKRRQQKPKVAFLRFHKPSPPSPHPVSQPPLSGRFINLIRNRFNPRPPFPFMLRSPMTPPPIYNLIKPSRPLIPKIILSARSGMIPFSRMREFHPPMSGVPHMQRIEPPQFPDVTGPEDNFPIIPDVQPVDPIDQAADGFQADLGQEFAQYPINDGFQTPTAHETEMPADAMMQVDLPSKPVEMPELIVEQAPLAGNDKHNTLVSRKSEVLKQFLFSLCLYVGLLVDYYTHKGNIRLYTLMANTSIYRVYSKNFGILIY